MKYYLLSLLLIVSLAACNNDNDFSNKIVEKIYVNQVIFSDGTKTMIPDGEKEDVVVFFLFRHAEKELIVGESDPDLSEVGKTRALRLASLINNSDIDKIYSTRFKRTFQTAQPSMKATSTTYNSFPPAELITHIESTLEEERGNRLMVVGHSNTTPYLVNLLTGEEVYGDIAEDDYSTFYIVSYKNKGDAKVLKLKY